MYTKIAVDSKEIIERYWTALIDCPVIHNVHGLGFIESYSNEEFTISINKNGMNTTIHLSELNKNHETWNVNTDEFREYEWDISGVLNEHANLVHKHLRMREVLGLENLYL